MAGYGIETYGPDGRVWLTQSTNACLLRGSTTLYAGDEVSINEMIGVKNPLVIVANPFWQKVTAFSSSGGGSMEINAPMSVGASFFGETGKLRYSGPFPYFQNSYVIVHYGNY